MLLLISTIKIYSQGSNQSLQKFEIGAIMSGKTLTNDEVHATFFESGMNTVVEHAGDDNRPLLSHYYLIPYNQNKGEWIHYFATGLYSKWEAEENQRNKESVGVKHKFGKETVWKNTKCWSSSGLQGPVDSLMYGPHYRQEKTYKRWGGNIPVNYVARYNMALDKNGARDHEDICRITVRVRHVRLVNGVWNRKVYDDTLAGPLTLKVSDFPADGSFKEFYFGNAEHRIYSYYPQYAERIDKRQPGGQDIVYSDSNPDNGIEFCVEWLGNRKTTLYIDNIEVYDNDGWNKYIDSPRSVVDSIQAYAKRFSSWPNIIYWYAHDEPNSRDAFVPMHTVNEILDSVDAAPLITHYYAGGLINGEDLLSLFYRTAKPRKLLIDIYPFSPLHNPVRWEDLESLRKQFQEASLLDSNFYYTPQAFGHWDLDKNKWITWRRPDSSELKASVMLALAHGAKGLIFSDYDSYAITSFLIDSAIVGTPEGNFKKQDLWFLIHENLVPRLSGKLGQKLIELKYTGNYISSRYLSASGNTAPETRDYLTIPARSSSFNMNWHAGLFISRDYPDDKYFFLVNLLPDTSGSAPITLAPPVNGFVNYRFRNYEGYFDTTFTGPRFTYILTQPPGEGYLYELAPVVKYGGKLYADESTQDQILHSDLIITDGVTLTVNGSYDCYANIYIPGSGKIKTVNGGKITFFNGCRIISKDHH